MNAACDDRIFIAGRWRQGRGTLSRSLLPADQSVNTELHQADLAVLDDATQAAERAWRDAGWRRRPPHRRAEILHRAANLSEQPRESLARLQTRDNGKPLAETRALVDSETVLRRSAAACVAVRSNARSPRAGQRARAQAGDWMQ